MAAKANEMTITARRRSATSMTVRRFQRSTYTPATRPTVKWGTASAMAMSASAAVEPVSWLMTSSSRSSVIPSPMSDTACPPMRLR